MSYAVILSPQAQDDLDRLFDFLLERELESPTGDMALPERAMQSIKDGFALLTHSPFTCRKAGDNPFVRELVISFGGAGYVALFEIVDSRQVVIGAVRHQREDDWH